MTKWRIGSKRRRRRRRRRKRRIRRRRRRGIKGRRRGRESEASSLADRWAFLIVLIILSDILILIGLT